MKFTVKDLVNASLFSVLIVVFYWCAGMLGFIPVTMPAIPFICGFVAGPAFMLYSTKIDKFGMMLILGIIVSLVFGLTGHGVYVIPGTVLLALIGEWILKMGGYKSINHARWAYTVFVLFAAFNLLPMFIAREAYVKHLLAGGYPQDFIDKMFAVLPQWSLLPITLFGALGGYLGATFGISILKKHFEKANMA